MLAGVIVSWPFAATTDRLSVGEEGVESLGFLGGCSRVPSAFRILGRPGAPLAPSVLPCWIGYRVT